MLSRILPFKQAITVLILMLLWSTVSGQRRILPSLNRANLQVVNRTVSVTAEPKQQSVVHLTGRPGAGMAWIAGVSFLKGAIELDIKGKDVLQQSFVGLAFDSVNDSTYEAVYFRPFNFRSADSVRRKHAVQYISLPDYDWPYLREAFTDQFEAALQHDTDPDNWFHVRLELTSDSLTVFVNRETSPVLAVKRLTKALTGKIGLWTGNGSDGDFRNLVIYPEK
jgi:hypothetical protein